jgi:hypothetical protein
MFLVPHLPGLIQDLSRQCNPVHAETAVLDIDAADGGGRIRSYRQSGRCSTTDDRCDAYRKRQHMARFALQIFAPTGRST